MAFFEQLGKRLSDAGQGVAQQTKNLADVTRLNSVITEKEKRIGQLYQAIGQGYYERHREDPASEEREAIEQINSLVAEIDKCREEIKQIKGVTKCASCGADIPLHAAFCNACGAKVAEETAGNQMGPREGRCPSCGQPVGSDNVFCIHCGTRVSGAAEQEIKIEEG